MSILENFFKNKKRLSEKPEPQKSVSPKIIQNEPVITHAKAILCDGKMYDTSKATKLFTTSEDERCFIDESVCRVYFVTANGRYFSARETTRHGKECKLLENIEVHIRDIYYSDLRVEAEITVKSMLGQRDIELYKQLFGEVEEA